MRMLIGRTLIKLGMAIIPGDVREMVRDILLYNVSGALTETRKAQIRAAKAVSDERNA